MKNKKTIYLLSSLAAVIALVIGGFIYLQQLHKPDNVIKIFTEAVENDQPGLLTPLLVPNDTMAEVNHDTLQSLVNYLKKNHNSYQTVKDSLHTQIEKKDFSPTNQQISLITDGKRMGIFPQYKLQVKTGFVKISGQHEEDKVKIQVQTVKKPLLEKEENVYGPLLPGIHSVTVTVKNDLGTVLDKSEIDVWGSEQVSLLVDTKKLVREDETIQNNILTAIDIFNRDISKFTTSEFDMNAFTNISHSSEHEQNFLASQFNNVKDYIDEIHSQYLGTVINLDAFDMNYFNELWSVKVSALVSYNEKIKLREQPNFEDASYKAIRTYSLYFDKDKKEWLITDFADIEATGSEPKKWESTQDMTLKDAPVLKWTRTNDGTSL